MSELRMRVAILGATGHVGACFTAGLLADERFAVTAIARDASRLGALLDTLPNGAACARRSFGEFPTGDFDAVVNCVGVGTPAAVAASGPGIFELTDRFDALALDYARAHPGTRYIALSSGAAYGGDFTEPASEVTPAVVRANAMRPSDHYGAAKLAAEVRHRATADLAIVDLRLFGLFSRHIDLDAGYFMTDVFRAIVGDTSLTVSPEDVVRDYVDPDDLVAVLIAVLDAPAHNDVYDVYSAAPVSKFELLAHFSARYGLTYDVADATASDSATGVKPKYYSLNRRAERVGYTPSLTSLASVAKETDVLLELRRGGLR